MNKNTNYSQILWSLAKTDFKMRYHGSILGYLWSLIKPLLIFAVLYLVFSVLMRWDIPNFQLYLLLGIIIWNFFAEGTMMGLNALVSKSNLIKKIYFPRILVVIASICSSFLTLLINFLIFFLVYFLSELNFHLGLLLFPIYLVLIFLLVIGLSFILSILQAKFKDTSQIWEVFLQAGFFLTPIIYPISFIPESYRFYLFINPITGIVQYSRLLVLENQNPSILGTIYVLCIIALFVLLGLYIFNKFSNKVIEDL